MERKISILSQIKKIVKLCEKSNISRIKYDNFEIDFFQKEDSAKRKKTETKIASDTSGDNTMPEDDVMLFAATDHFNDLVAKKGK